MQKQSSALSSYYCSPAQLSAVRSFAYQNATNQSPTCLVSVLGLLAPTSLDVQNRPLQGIATSALNSYCTAACYGHIQAVKANLFPPCDTIVDGSVRSIGSVAMDLCPQGANVATVPVATRPPNRTGTYCSYAQYDNMSRDLGLNDQSTPCGSTARSALVPTLIAFDINNIPFSNVTWSMVNAVCTPTCATLLVKMKAYSYPDCDGLINLETTLSLSEIGQL
ncbi:hypothetical protein SPRG_01081 [Saprolegnia parasitica CBS 223.65]|uniref:Uncharacterized protein n=1 Tax=Saprolegnia parasitica (strain CBS 223.65) TaxID=695850 RepID=A0A067CWX5_SAPPC|nr:hypothetical protein SPRG_01081 [Saprolegnia parasitica CBS 223.65]KDO35018.1 hypothetical protein SPRG_01081 [Saprolegnia parasitica CBS 223.65]|eukprot:XP_012194671.1 hypothetical protein SPRG_01081 [Saprolegnia parasitica CBS 223.65]